MISRALAALALGGLLLFLLPADFQTSEANQFGSVPSQSIQRYQQTLAKARQVQNARENTVVEVYRVDELRENK